MPPALSRRQIEVAAAAAPVFLKNGFQRTTMGEIAAAAGLTRPGLYLIFPHKEAAFAAAVTVLNERLHGTFAAGLGVRQGRRARLAFVCEQWVAGIYDLQAQRPQARDMDDLSFEIVREVYQQFVELVAAILSEGRDLPLEPAEALALARVLVFGFRGLSHTATDSGDLRGLVARLIDGVLLAADAAAELRQGAVA